MSDITIYHNGRCSKSRGALEILQEKGIMPEIRYYLVEPLSETELRALLKKLGMKAEALVRKTEALYKEQYKGRELSNDEWIRILAENPVLIERPIVERGQKAIVARPPEKVLEIL
jgi:arsenate reductase (glutaredoxin)